MTLATHTHEPRQLRLIIDNENGLPQTADASADFCQAMARWLAVRAYNPQSELRLIAFNSLQRFAPEVAAALDRNTWGFN